MGRIVTNKYINNPVVARQDFYEDINVSNDSERTRIARGRIILAPGLNSSGYIDTNTTVIWGINNNDQPIILAQSLNVELPSEIAQAIASAISGAIDKVEDYADSEIERKIDEFSLLVISSADTMYSKLKGYIDTLSSNTETITNEINGRIDELSAYTMNLKFSDHFMLTEDEYRMLTLSEGKMLPVDAEEFFVSRETRELNDLHIGDVIKYNEDIYYCIYDEKGGGEESGNTPTFSGSTMEIFYDVLPQDHTIILDNSATISGNTMEFSNGGGSETKISDGAIKDDTVHTDEDSEHTLVLGDNYTYDEEENNTFIIN